MIFSICLAKVNIYSKVALEIFDFGDWNFFRMEFGMKAITLSVELVLHIAMANCFRLEAFWSILSVIISFNSSIRV